VKIQTHTQNTVCNTCCNVYTRAYTGITYLYCIHVHWCDRPTGMHV